MASVKALPEVDIDTGEITGQLTIAGIDVPTVQVQRRADIVMRMGEFNDVQWQLDEGDRLTATMKDGLLRVKITEGWA